MCNIHINAESLACPKFQPLLFTKPKLFLLHIPLHFFNNYQFDFKGLSLVNSSPIIFFTIDTHLHFCNLFKKHNGFVRQRMTNPFFRKSLIRFASIEYLESVKIILEYTVGWLARDDVGGYESHVEKASSLVVCRVHFSNISPLAKIKSMINRFFPNPFTRFRIWMNV